MTVVVVFLFLGSWGDLLGPLIYLDNNKKLAVAIGLATFHPRQSKQQLADGLQPHCEAPRMVIYFFAQEKLIGGIASVGLKG